MGAVLLALASYAFTLAELNDVFDHELKQVALTALTHHPEDGVSRGASRQGAQFAFVTQVWSDDGTRLFVSAAPGSIPFTRAEGFQTLSDRDVLWRVYTVRSGSRVVQAAQPLEVRRQLAAETATKLLLPSMLMVLLIAVLLGFALQRGLAPLAAAAADIERRSAVSLERIPAAALPEEIQPLIGSINLLMQRLSQALCAQRQFIADAAHELRTPLTALRLQVQLLENARGEGARAQALVELKRGLERASHLVAQLLDLSRLEPDGAAHASRPVDLAALARAVVGGSSAEAERKDIDLGAEASMAVPITGDEAELRLLIRNLVENALRYTPAGGRVDVRVGRDTRHAILKVCDNGLGIPSGEEARVFDRFFRASNTAEHDGAVPGTGLGLAIVKAIAERHRAVLALGTGIDGRGLEVQVSFPAGDRG